MSKAKTARRKRSRKNRRYGTKIKKSRICALGEPLNWAPQVKKQSSELKNTTSCEMPSSRQPITSRVSDWPHRISDKMWEWPPRLHMRHPKNTLITRGEPEQGKTCSSRGKRGYKCVQCSEMRCQEMMMKRWCMWGTERSQDTSASNPAEKGLERAEIKV